MSCVSTSLKAEDGRMLWVPVKIKRFALFSMLCCMALSGSPVSADSVWVSELQNEVTSGQVDKIKTDLISAENLGPPYLY